VNAPYSIERSFNFPTAAKITNCEWEEQTFSQFEKILKIHNAEKGDSFSKN